MAQVLSSIEAEAKSGGRKPGMVRTGFEILDDVMEGGIRAGDLVLVGGPPGVGKTVATLQWARNIAADGHPAVFVCYEHDERALFARVLQLEVGSLPTDRTGLKPGELRRTMRSVSRAERSLRDEIAGNLALRAACARVGRYEDRLSLVRGDGHLGLAELESIAAGIEARPGVVFVDYLQKVPVSASTDEERIIVVAERLKELALTYDLAVVAIVSSDLAGLVERRLRLRHIRGAAGLAYEADVVLMLNEKFTAVSRSHTSYDPVAAQRFRRQVVFSVEKNRDGPSPIDVQFDKDFEHFRFVPDGSALEERLTDDHFYVT